MSLYLNLGTLPADMVVFSQGLGSETLGTPDVIYFRSNSTGIEFEIPMDRFCKLVEYSLQNSMSVGPRGHCGLFFLDRLVTGFLLCESGYKGTASISCDDWCILVKYVFENTNLKSRDPREELLAAVQEIFPLDPLLPEAHNGSCRFPELLVFFRNLILTKGYGGVGCRFSTPAGLLLS